MERFLAAGEFNDLAFEVACHLGVGSCRKLRSVSRQLSRVATDFVALLDRICPERVLICGGYTEAVINPLSVDCFNLTTRDWEKMAAPPRAPGSHAPDFTLGPAVCYPSTTLRRQTTLHVSMRCRLHPLLHG
eukprot:TRINITY_DN21192_c0_g3_i1.p2 TRINITY_DN21192_c0_g3~~TRINITY_DN21192_c0_g3_i1.p2  ORF type:complete len:132 (-),score=1.17 TRINITY_DN21192_c0_g3_i1:339-734(-)